MKGSAHALYIYNVCKLKSQVYKQFTSLNNFAERPRGNVQQTKRFSAMNLFANVSSSNVKYSKHKT